MAQAARVGDRITHTNAYAGLVVGALAGAAIAGLCIATGGAALPAIAVAAAGGAGLGGVIGEFAAGFTTSDTGMIVDGSGDVDTDARRAARAGDPVTCSWHAGAQRIAEGSATVLVDERPAARLGDRTTCGAQIASGSGDVDIGGPTHTVLKVNGEVPLIAELAVLGLGLISGAGEIALAADGLKLARAAQLAKGLAAGLGFGTAGSVAGGAIWGEGSRGQRQLALGSGLFGAGLASGLLAGRADPMGVGGAADGAAADAGAADAAQGATVRTAAEANQAMVEAGNLGAWGGTTVTTETVPAGTPFNMVVSEGQAQALMAGKPAFGAWATPDAIPSQAFARNDLAILGEFKPDVSFVAQVETTAPQTLNRGIVGALGDQAGGANQVEFLGAKNLRLVGSPQPLPLGP